MNLHKSPPQQKKKSPAGTFSSRHSRRQTTTTSWTTFTTMGLIFVSIVIFVINNLAFVRWLSHHDETTGENFGAVKRHRLDIASANTQPLQESPPKAKATVGDNLVSLDINKICPRSSAINTINSSSPPSQLMSTAKLRSVVKHWHEINCPEKNTCNFSSIGQHLLHLAIKWNQTLLTVQVGAMDGRTNDPMYGMFVKTWGKNYVQAREIVPGEDSSFPNLSNWLPVMIEPVPKNYDDMEQTYLGVANDKGLGCAVPINAAVSYDSEKSSCAFCRVNTAEDSPQRCKELPDWKRLQIGTLDCEYLQKILKTDFDLCVLQNPLPCNSMVKLLSDKFVPAEYIAMLQIDIEGYEYILLDRVFREIPDNYLPPVIHFEHKVMFDMDKKHPLVNRTSRLYHVMELMMSKGYQLYDENEDDYLAIRL